MLETLYEWYAIAFEDAVYTRQEGALVKPEGAEDDVEEVQRPENFEEEVRFNAKAMVLQTYSASVQRNEALFDIGSNVHIVNNSTKFRQSTVRQIEKGQILINTGAGAVFAEAIGEADWVFTAPDGGRTSIKTKHTLLVRNFPINIFSGESFYRGDGYLDRNTLRNALGDALTTIDVKKRGFLLWGYGLPEPEISSHAK